LKTFLLAAGSSYSLSPPLPTLSSSMDLRMASSEVQMAFDPLSPFVLCMERLSQAISKAVDFGAWKPGKRWAEVISPLLRRRPYSLCGGKVRPSADYLGVLLFALVPGRK
jgi:hypothetical protein